MCTTFVMGREKKRRKLLTACIKFTWINVLEIFETLFRENMEPTGSGDDIITNSAHVMCQFILSRSKYLFFFSFRILWLQWIRGWSLTKLSLLEQNTAPWISFSSFLLSFLGGGGGCKLHRAEPRGRARRQCSDIKGERSSRFYLSFLNSAFKYWSEFGMKKSFRELGRRVECLYGPRQVWRVGLEVMHTKSYCAGIIYG